MIFSHQVRSDGSRARRGEGVAASALVHLVLAAIALWVAQAPSNLSSIQKTNSAEMPRLVWIPAPTPGGGGGGGGRRSVDPPAAAQLPGSERLSVPAAYERDTAVTAAAETSHVPEVLISAKPMASAQEMFAGTIAEERPLSQSQGPGEGSNAGRGMGTGAGDGRGRGLNDGLDRGNGGDRYRVGNGVTGPRLVRDVKPAYTAEAMRARVQGAFLLECVVNRDGRVGDVRILRAIDPSFGLETEAVKAARQWLFEPGRRNGAPVPVVITIELAFTLR